jgi:DNA gyrase subunit A
LEILVIQKELREKRRRAREIKRLLADAKGKGRWEIVKSELQELVTTFGRANKRRTLIEAVEAEPEFTKEDLIVAEDNHVLLTRDGWVKRQREIRDPAATRLREGDGVLTCAAGSTRASIVFLSTFGTAYTCRFIDIVATTGYGEPIQKLFKLKDGERILAALSLDPRVVGNLEEKPGYFPETYAVAATSDGFALSFGLAQFAEPSTRSGRRYARPQKGHRVVAVQKVHGEEAVISVSKQRRALVCKVQDINYLAGPGKGVMLLKVADGDELLGIKATSNERDGLIVKTSLGGEQRITTNKYGLTTRGGRGREVMKRGHFTSIVAEPPAAPEPLDQDD